MMNLVFAAQPGGTLMYLVFAAQPGGRKRIAHGVSRGTRDGLFAQPRNGA